MVQDLREESIIIFEVRSLIAVILTRPVRLTYVDSDTNKRIFIRYNHFKMFFLTHVLIYVVLYQMSFFGHMYELLDKYQLFNEQKIKLLINRM